MSLFCWNCKMVPIVKKKKVNCFTSLCLDASWNRSACQPRRPLVGGHLRSLDGVHLQLLDGFHSLHSCQAACCQSPDCDAFWLLGNMCIQVNCPSPPGCQATQTSATDSILVFVKKPGHALSSWPAAERKTQLPKWLDWREGRARSNTRMRRALQEPRTRRVRKADKIRSSLKRDLSSGGGSPVSPPAPSQPVNSKDSAEPQSSEQDANLPRDHANPDRVLLHNKESQSPSLPAANNVNSPRNPAESDDGGVSVCLQR